MGVLTSAITKVQVKSRRRPRFTVRVRTPYASMGVLLAAYRMNEGPFSRSRSVAGMPMLMLDNGLVYAGLQRLVC